MSGLFAEAQKSARARVMGWVGEMLSNAKVPCADAGVGVMG